jgi:DNA-binding response OmpR family regulator
MTLESLLLSQDAELVSVIRPTLESLSIDVEICPEARAGNEKLISDKFDAVIVDCDDLEGGLTVLKELRNTPSNKRKLRLTEAHHDAECVQMLSRRAEFHA